MNAPPIIFLELNEVNFKFVDSYIEQGHLPNFKDFFSVHGYSETTSETDYEALEPWIQWVTAHTGLSLNEHGVFRLGDITSYDIKQIWEHLADQGVSVGAISPMNAKCRGESWDFFIPDPWTSTAIVASPIARRMYQAIAQIVNDNAQQRVSPGSLLNLAIGGALTALPSSYPAYFNYITQARTKPWFKAIFLDLLLSDLFLRSVAKKRTQFATLFLNAAAHIQHHFMFSSTIYDGPMRNPEWYIAPKHDPLLDVYTAYDRILGRTRARFPQSRVMLATGLHQDPHSDVTFYWRLKDHANFLKKIGVDFVTVEPRMSRDFLVTFDSFSTAATAEVFLNSAQSDQGTALFEVDNRGQDLFVMLTYPNDINDVGHYVVNGEIYNDLIDEVTFVAIKNGCHNGIGYFADSGLIRNAASLQFALSDIPKRILTALQLRGVPWH
ncbi:MAG: hypothetical protein ABI668_00315 [Sphingorhabdus sp.]